MGRGLWAFKFHSERPRKPMEEVGKGVMAAHFFSEGFRLCRLYDLWCNDSLRESSHRQNIKE